MARFDSAIQLADRLLTRNGELATIRRPVDGAPPDSSKPWEPGDATNDDHECAAVFINHSCARALGVLVQDAQQAVLVSAEDLDDFVPDPATDVLIRASGEKWTIVKVETLNPNGQTIMHTLVVEA